MAEIDPISFEGVKCNRLHDRKSTVNVEHFGKPWQVGESFSTWLEFLPGILAARDFIEIATRVSGAAADGKTVLLAMGAHPVKVGISPVIIELMRRKILSGIAMNGACAIHDTEVAMAGCTSEDVAASLDSGDFGMAEETGSFINEAISRAARTNTGLGNSLGEMLATEGFPHNRSSILASAHELNIPVTVHVAIGTDIIHMHPSADGSATGASSHLDFRRFATQVSTLEHGVFINLGSAVVMPEVFLKALSVVRNLGYQVNEITTVNMDFIKQYRPLTNVVNRPTQHGGRGYNLVGHHEIMFPLLAAAVMEILERRRR
ncbi:MAG TPA: hypothetical protein ENN79_13875 [Desulfobacteraceae bacterium]|nr:hypothetical protein [Desulfobacteraceae bacterium]